MVNIVLVPNKDEKVRMCVDYRDLTNASPKDNFSLSQIDVLVDNIIGQVLFFFMNGLSGYNQIRMGSEDWDFIHNFLGYILYKVMSFGLKNAEATYQRTRTAYVIHGAKDGSVYRRYVSQIHDWARPSR